MYLRGDLPVRAHVRALKYLNVYQVSAKHWQDHCSYVDHFIHQIPVFSFVICSNKGNHSFFFIYISCVACFLKHSVISPFYFDRAGWNIFLTTASDDLSKLAQDTIQFWRNCNVITKLIICIFLFIIVLGTSVINKICFIIITSNIHVFTENDTSRQSLRTARGTIDFLGYTGDINKTNVLWIWSLVLIIGTPYVFIIGKCTWRLYGQMTRRKPVNLLTLLPVR